MVGLPPEDALLLSEILISYSLSTHTHTKTHTNTHTQRFEPSGLCIFGGVFSNVKYFCTKQKIKEDFDSYWLKLWSHESCQEGAELGTVAAVHWLALCLQPLVGTGALWDRPPKWEEVEPTPRSGAMPSVMSPTGAE